MQLSLSLLASLLCFTLFNTALCSAYQGSPLIVETFQGNYGLVMNGTWVIPPVCADIWADNGLYIFQTSEDRWGFYNRESNLLYGPVDESIMTFNASQGQLLMIENNNGYYGFIDCYTGELVIPYQFNGFYDDVGCFNGYVLAANEITAESCIIPEYYLYTDKGVQIHFPSGIMPYSNVESDYVIVIKRRSNGQPYYGLATCSGEIVLDTIYRKIDFLDGIGISVTTPKGESLIIPFDGLPDNTNH